MADNDLTVAESGGGTKEIAGDEIGGIYYQRVKPVLGADGTANDISAGAGATGTGTIRVVLANDDALIGAVNVAKVTDPDGASASTNQLLRGILQKTTDGIVAAGQAAMAASMPVTMASNQTAMTVGGTTVTKTITMTADTSIMASADIIADTQQLNAAFRITDGTGVLQSMTVFDPDDNAAFAFDVYVHRTTTSMGSENSGITISDANAAAGIIGVVSFATTDAKDLINGRMYHKANIGLPVTAVSGTDDLYFSVVNGSGTPTFAGGSIPIVVGILQD